MPKKEEECIASWGRHFPDYELRLWNEENFDYSSCTFAEQAYEHRKYAFVSDYARAKILYEQGGLYLDTDVEVLTSFSGLLEHKEGVVGFERKAFIGTAVIASLPKNPCIKELLDYYESHEFAQADGSFDHIANVSVLTDILKEYGLELGGARQTVGGFEVYNREWFYPKKLDETNFKVTEETVAIHMCSNSWLTERERRRGNNRLWIEIIRPALRACRSLGIQVIGKERIRKIEIKLRNKIR